MVYATHLMWPILIRYLTKIRNYSNKLIEINTFYQFNRYRLHSDYNYLENNKKVNKWSLERGYQTEDSFDEFPWRVLGAGNNTGLIVSLYSDDRDIDPFCRYSDQGFKVNNYIFIYLLLL